MLNLIHVTGSAIELLSVMLEETTPNVGLIAKVMRYTQLIVQLVEYSVAMVAVLYPVNKTS